MCAKKKKNRVNKFRQDLSKQLLAVAITVYLNKLKFYGNEWALMGKMNVLPEA